jgi:nucleotide-binding universal stress UspA family protein
MAHILACTDGSVYAASVYDHAAWAAKRMSGWVEVLHVLDHDGTLAPADLSGSIGIDARDGLMEELVQLDAAQSKLAQKKSRLILDDASARLKAAGVEDLRLIQRHGSLIETLEAFEATADLVVIGKRGESADFATLHLGSNLERVVRASRKPILVASRAYKPIDRMLIAFDGGPSALKAVEYAADKPLLAGIECHVLMVGLETPKTRAQLDKARDRLATRGRTVEARFLTGEPEEVISEYVRDNGIGLLVMGAYGHSRIRQFIVGSTTTEMIRTCLVPVLMFR